MKTEIIEWYTPYEKLPSENTPICVVTGERNEQGEIVPTLYDIAKFVVMKDISGNDVQVWYDASDEADPFDSYIGPVIEWAYAPNGSNEINILETVDALEAEIERLTKALAEANAKLGNLSDTFRRLPPITAEALWELGFIPETAKYGGEQFARDIDANTQIVVGFWNDEPTVKIVHMGRDVLTPGVTTMYQLGQLVELLGWSK